jgi:hypothetical protein
MTVNPDFSMVGEPEDIFSDLMTRSTIITKGNRRSALKLLDKANDIEERAAIVANKYRELAAALILEAQSYASDVADMLVEEFPLEFPGGSEEEEA